MGQKVNPIGLRLGINRTWDSRWYANDQDYAEPAARGPEDPRLPARSACRRPASAAIVIERPAKKARITIHTARPGVVIGKKGADIEKLRRDVCASMTDSEVHLNIVEIRKPEIDAKLVAENIAQQLERRVAFRRAMKRAVQSAMRLGAEGIRINCGGRLGGAEIARTEWYREGRVPLHTLRADIDYGTATAQHDLRHLRRQGLGVQGRDPGARPDGAGQASRRTAGRVARLNGRRSRNDASTEAHQVPQGAQGPYPRHWPRAVPSSISAPSA